MVAVQRRQPYGESLCRVAVWLCFLERARTRLDAGGSRKRGGLPHVEVLLGISQQFTACIRQSTYSCERRLTSSLRSLLSRGPAVPELRSIFLSLRRRRLHFFA
jgi:hypothetical protein